MTHTAPKVREPEDENSKCHDTYTDLGSTAEGCREAGG